jgi:hypothetical protein
MVSVGLVSRVGVVVVRIAPSLYIPTPKRVQVAKVFRDLVIGVVGGGL